MPPKRARPQSSRVAKRSKSSQSSRPVARRTAARSRIARSKLSLNVHRFRRYTASSTISCVAGVGTQPTAFQFKLSDVINAGEFTTLFDRYRLDRVVIKFQLISNPDAASLPNVGGGGNASNFYPKMWYINDYDDANTETISQLQERANTKCCILKPNMIKTITLVPAIASQVFSTAVTAGYAPKFRQYLDIAYPDVPHYGLKTLIDFLGLSNFSAYSVRVDKQYYFTCKDVR